ncbi:unnamed protein product [Microthlaspi erraticum]|uniref:Uncharacterized protein n=1 Tax=Microthlaspi erraticum TaxID=1685480 RepID=A0A6D2JGN0_9BRAS|nr:unnamed protein product [Microthlaspi erraticum]
MSSKCTYLFGQGPIKNSRVKRAQAGVVEGWVTFREVLCETVCSCLGPCSEMDGPPRGHGARGRGARGRGGRAGGRAGRGRGRGLPEESAESVAPSVHTASVTQSVSLADDASVGLGAGAAPGWGGSPTQQ